MGDVKQGWCKHAPWESEASGVVSQLTIRIERARRCAQDLNLNDCTAPIASLEEQMHPIYAD